MPAAEAGDLAARVAAHPRWYHSIELAPGVVTPGVIDLRGTAPAVLPADLTGRRALDVGTFDGFWAFELERRGARTVATDVAAMDAAQWPPLTRDRLQAETEALGLVLGDGFRLAAAALGSEVSRVEVDVYDLTPEAIGGPVDIAFVGALLLHLRDPVRALERVAGALAPGGRIIVLETIDPLTTLLAPREPIGRFRADRTDFNWWVPNLAGLRAWLVAAGFVDVRRGGLHRPPARLGMEGRTYAALSARPG